MPLDPPFDDCPSLPTDAFINEFLESVRQRRVLLACSAIQMLKTRGEQRVLEHRFACYFEERDGARALSFRGVFLHGVEPRCQVQQIPIVASRLHVMAAVFEAEACLPSRLRNLLLCPPKEGNLSIHDSVVYDAARFLCDLRAEDAEEVLRSGAGCHFQNTEGKALDVVRFGSLINDR